MLESLIGNLGTLDLIGPLWNVELHSSCPWCLFHAMPELMSMFLAFVGLSPAVSGSILILHLLLLGVIMRGLIRVLGLETLAIVWPSLRMIVGLHLIGIPRWVWHGVVTVSIW